MAKGLVGLLGFRVFRAPKHYKTAAGDAAEADGSA